VIVLSEYALPSLPVGALLPLAGMAGKEAVGGRLYVTNLRVVFKAHAARESLHGLDLNQPAETLNAEAREMFDIGERDADTPRTEEPIQLPRRRRSERPPAHQRNMNHRTLSLDRVPGLFGRESAISAEL
jgi:hypothetical protein